MGGIGQSCLPQFRPLLSHNSQATRERKDHGVCKSVVLSLYFNPFLYLFLNILAHAWECPQLHWRPRWISYFTEREGSSQYVTNCLKKGMHPNCEHLIPFNSLYTKKKKNCNSRITASHMILFSSGNTILGRKGTKKCSIDMVQTKTSRISLSETIITFNFTPSSHLNLQYSSVILSTLCTAHHSMNSFEDQVTHHLSLYFH